MSALAVAFSTLPFLTLAPSLLPIPDARSPCLLVAALHLASALAAIASSRWQPNTSSYLSVTTACLATISTYLCLHLAGASLNASVAANVFLGCILAPAQISRLKRLLQNAVSGREIVLSRFIVCSSPGGLASSLLGVLLLLLSATLGAHPTTTSIFIGSGHQSVE